MLLFPEAPPEWPTPEMVEVPSPPYALRGCQTVFISVAFGPEVLSLVPSELATAPGLTGGFYIVSAPHGSALTPLTKLSCWIDIEGYSGSPGTFGRYTPFFYMSGSAGPVFRNLYCAASLEGSAWQVIGSDGVVRAGGGPPGHEYVRMALRPAEGDPKELGILRRWLARNGDGRIVVHTTPASADSWHAEPLELEVQAPPGHPFTLMRPQRLLSALLVRNASITWGMFAPINEPHDETAGMALPTMMRLFPSGVVLVDHGRVVEMNATARAFLGDGIVVRQGQLRASVRGDQEGLDRLIAATWAPGDTTGEVAVLRRPSGRKSLLARAVTTGTGQTPGSVLVVVTDPERRTSSDPTRGLTLLGLTPSEARVAAMIGGGLSPRETAASLERSEGSVRASLQTVYSKLELGRQSELAHLVRNLELGG